MILSNRNSLSRTPVIALAILLISLVPRCLNLGKEPLESRGFRETQTAYTVKIFLQEGVSVLNYQTPVLGKPYTIPFEFPVYQLTAWAVVKLTGLSADQACLVTSIGYYLLAACFLYLICLQYFKNSGFALTAITVFAFLPINMIYSSAVLIESCAVCFSLAFIYYYIYFLKYQQTDRKKAGWYCLLSIVIGSLAILIKATTAYVYLLVALVITLQHWYTYYRKGKNIAGGLVEVWKAQQSYVLQYLLIGGIQLLVLIIWVKHCDTLKAQSVFSVFTTSANLNKWNYGTWHQKFSLLSWKTIYHRFFSTYIPFFALPACLFPYTWKKIAASPRLQPAILSVIIAGISIFTFVRLYVVHDYYSYAIMPLFVFTISFILFDGYWPLLKSFSRWGQLAAVVIAILLLACQLFYKKSNFNYTYLTELLPPVKPDSAATVELRIAKEIEKRSSAKDAVLVTDFDWSPPCLYYSNRKGLMFREDDSSLMTADRLHEFQLIVCPNPARHQRMLHLLPLDTLFTDKDHVTYYKPRF